MIDTCNIDTGYSRLTSAVLNLSTSERHSMSYKSKMIDRIGI